ILPAAVALLVERSHPSRAGHPDRPANRILLGAIDQHRGPLVDRMEAEITDFVAGDLARLAGNTPQHTILADVADVAIELDMIVRQEALPEADVHLLPRDPALLLERDQFAFGRRGGRGLGRSGRACE